MTRLRQRKAPHPPDPTPYAVLDLEEAGKELKTAYEALAVARSYISGQDLDGQRFSPREALEVVNAALAKARESPTVRLRRTGAVAIPQQTKRRLPPKRT